MIQVRPIVLIVSETATAAPPREGSVLLVAAGAAFLALLDTTVANLAVADVRATSPAPP